MNLLYWNLHSNSELETIIADCISENEVDIALFSEYERIDFDKLNNLLSSQYNLLISLGERKTVKVLYRKSIQLSLIQEQHRYLLAKLQLKNKIYLIVGTHLPSDIRGDTSSTRKNIIRKIINDVVDIEEKEQIQSSLIIGDMNASPFDAEMIEKDAFNSVLFKKVIKQHEFVTFAEDTYRRFYNPIIEYINETNENYGSYYYAAGNDCLYRYCFDQLLVRKNLIDKIKGFQYLKKISHQSLIGRSMPKKEISDHLPLLVNIKI